MRQVCDTSNVFFVSADSGKSWKKADMKNGASFDVKKLYVISSKENERITTECLVDGKSIVISGLGADIVLHRDELVSGGYELSRDKALTNSERSMYWDLLRSNDFDIQVIGEKNEEV